MRGGAGAAHGRGWAGRGLLKTPCSRPLGEGRAAARVRPSQRSTSGSRCAMGLGRVSCSRRETAGHRCCSRGGQAGPGRTAAHQGWSVLGAAENDEANWPWTCLTPAGPPCPHVPARSGVELGCGAPLLPTGLAPEPLSLQGELSLQRQLCDQESLMPSCPRSTLDTQRPAQVGSWYTGSTRL